ncbi:hypothetical protein BC831DRAFT_445116, partial [Entophlyctis helioformis]
MRAQQQRAMPDPDAVALAAQLHTSNNEPNDDDGNAGDSTDMDSARLLDESFRGDGEGSLLKVACSRQSSRPCSRAACRGCLRGVPNKAGGQKAGCRQASSKGRWQDGR